MILGIDIGGTSTKLGLVDEGRVIARARMSTPGHADENAFADALAREALHLAGEHGQRMTAIGIGAPNGNQHSGVIDRAPNLPWRINVPLAKMMGERLGLPCVLGNDANAAALGEWKYGAGRGCNDLLVVTLGTGLGSGFIVDGRLLLGPHGNAGELGHTIVQRDGRLCTCGRKGCLEAYVSVRGLQQTYDDLEFGPSTPPVFFTEGDPPHASGGARSIADLARRGNYQARHAFDRTAYWLAIGLANAVAITVPERIVLFGGLARNGDMLMVPLRGCFDDLLLNIYRGRVDLCVSELPEDDAGILGAAVFAAEERSANA